MASNGTIPALLAALALAGCGGDESGEEPGGGDGKPKQQASGSAGCIASWNAATKDVRAQASLTHRGDTPKDIHVGAYRGAAFTDTARFYDASGSPATEEVSVAPGDCVAVDRTSTGDTETNWVMVAPKANGAGKAWYFIDETGSHPLAKSPQPLDDERTVTIQGFGVDAKLMP